MSLLLTEADRLESSLTYKRALARCDLIEFTELTCPYYRTAWHHRLVASKLEQLRAGTIKRLVVNMPPRMGKALAGPTPIPTPDGWRHIRDLAPGDMVLTKRGDPTRVMATRRWAARPTCIVHADDGSSVIADEAHEWQVRTPDGYQVVETATLCNRDGVYVTDPVPRLGHLRFYGSAQRRIWAQPAETQDTICIEVESDDHMFLCGRGALPTHNSELMSRRFPAWALGVDPNERIIACSYNDDMAKSFNRDVQRIMGSHEYLRTFPTTRLNARNTVSDAHSRYLRNSQIFEVVGSRGYYLSSGVGGGITGRGSTIGLIDDPIKNHSEAYSFTYRDKLWDWYTSTFLTRGEGKFVTGGDLRIGISVTRWHEDDLVGRLIDRMKAEDDHEWHVVNLPAILDCEPTEGDPRDQGDALWPEKYDLKHLRQFQYNEVDWNSLYQQRPSAAGGGMFKRKWWNTYDEIPHFHTIFTSWDLAVKGVPVRGRPNNRSYTVGLVIGVRHNMFYVLDMVRFQGEFVEQLDAFKALAKKWPLAFAHVVEAKANGPALISAMSKYVGGIVPWEPSSAERDGLKRRPGTSGKESRAASVTPLVSAGRVYLPSDAPWRQDFIDEHANFPAAKTDDIVDAMVQALQYADKNPALMYAALAAQA